MQEDLETDEATLEESCRVLKTDLQARPAFAWNDNHIKGHFAMCYICLSIIRYLQYLMGESGWPVILSIEEIMKALLQPIPQSINYL